MLTHNTARLGKGSPVVDQFVVGSQECEVQLSDYGVFVIAGVTDICSTVGCWIVGPWPAREIVEIVFTGGSTKWWVRTRCRAHRSQHHLVAVARGGEIVDAVEIERRGAGIFESVTNLIERKWCKRRIGECRQISGGELESNIVIDKLSEIGHERRHVRIPGGITSRLVDHSLTEPYQVCRSARVLWKQVVGIVLKVGEQEIKIL